MWHVSYKMEVLKTIHVESPFNLPFSTTTREFNNTLLKRAMIAAVKLHSTHAPIEHGSVIPYPRLLLGVRLSAYWQRTLFTNVKYL